MIEGDRFRLIAKKDNSKQMNYIILAKGIENQETHKKGYLCKDEDGETKWFGYAQFHALHSQGAIEYITKDGEPV